MSHQELKRQYRHVYQPQPDRVPRWMRQLWSLL